MDSDLTRVQILGAVFKQLGQRVLPRVANFVDLLMRLLEPALQDSSVRLVASVFFFKALLAFSSL